MKLRKVSCLIFNFFKLFWKSWGSFSSAICNFFLGSIMLCKSFVKTS